MELAKPSFEAIAGGIAGFAKTLLSHPLKMLQTSNQILLPTNPAAPSTSSPIPVDRFSHAMTGLRGLYVGLPQQAARNAIEHGCQMMCRSYFQSTLKGHGFENLADNMIVIGALAGVPQAILIAPFDKVMVDWFRHGKMNLVQRDAYRGIGGVLAKEISTGALFFFMYTELKKRFAADGDPLKGGACGTVAATTTFISSYPLDTVSRRMQAGATWNQAMLDRSFFSGFKFGVLRCLLSNFLALFMYEVVIKKVRLLDAEKRMAEAIVSRDAMASMDTATRRPSSVVMASLAPRHRRRDLALATVSLSHLRLD